MLKAELDEHLDYGYGETPLSLNTRNGSSKKSIKSSYGEIGIEILRDISSHIKEIYGFGLSESMVSRITNKILPTIEEWQSRQLDRVHPFVFLDAIHYNVRDNGVIVKKVKKGNKK